jgi:hypothetical protein
MLRASVEYHGQEGDLRALTEGSKAGDGGILHGTRLTSFAEAGVAGDPAELATARDALRAAAGSEAVVDAAAVIGNFQRMVRIADGTGIPLDGVMVGASNDFREEIGLDDFQTRRQAELGRVGSLAAPLLRAAAKFGLRLAGRRSRRA